MQDSSSKPTHGLPENAFRELAPGETYKPLVPADASVPEVTTRSILFGLGMTLVFSLAAAFIALKLGQGIEAAIPIAILAIGFSALKARKSTLLENVNIVSFGATAGMIVGGAVFVMPAIYILGLEGRSNFLQIFIVPLLGAILGVIFLVPFRRYFVADMHGKLPFPEATATTEILVAGERGGKQAQILLYAMGVGIVLDFLALNLQLWRDMFSTAVIGPLHGADREREDGVSAEHVRGDPRARLHHRSSLRGDDRRGLVTLVLGPGPALRQARLRWCRRRCFRGGRRSRGSGGRGSSISTCATSGSAGSSRPA